MVREIKDGKEVWNQPVGHIEPGEDLFNAAIREVFEETGFNTKLVALVGVYLWPANPNYTALRFCFVGDIVGGSLQPIATDEILFARWLSREELKAAEPEFRNPITKACLEDYFSGRRYPLDVISGRMANSANNLIE